MSDTITHRPVDELMTNKISVITGDKMITVFRWYEPEQINEREVSLGDTVVCNGMYHDEGLPERGVDGVVYHISYDLKNGNGNVRVRMSVRWADNTTSEAEADDIIWSEEVIGNAIRPLSRRPREVPRQVVDAPAAVSVEPRFVPCIHCGQSTPIAPTIEQLRRASDLLHRPVQDAVVKIPRTGIPLEDIERHALIEALQMSNWKQVDAAELLSISPRVMNYKVKTMGIEFPRGRRRAQNQASTGQPQLPANGGDPSE